MGVRHVLKSLLAELEITVGLAGCAKLADVNATFIVPNK
jgi:lactate 2-monooxygenase